MFSNTYPYLQTRSPGYREKVPLMRNSNGQLIADPKNHPFDEIALKALGGFVLILNENGEIYYASENIEAYLGFHQSDILHQPLFEMIHSEDREEIEQQLNWRCNLPPNFTCLQEVFSSDGIHYLERNISARFRCLLDNTCGFLRIDMRGKLMALHGIPRSIMFGRNDASNPGNIVLGLIAICSPFVPPIEQFVDDPILKTKHSLDLTLISMDNRMKSILEISDKNLPKSFYALIHNDDILYVAEAHREVTKNGVSGLLIYRIASARTNRTYWIQSSCRMFYKNGKPESIGLTHRLLTEVEGTVLLEKQATIRTKVVEYEGALINSTRGVAANEIHPSVKGVPPVIRQPDCVIQPCYFPTTYVPTLDTKKFGPQLSSKNEIKPAVHHASRNKRKKYPNNETVYPNSPMPNADSFHLNIFQTGQQNIQTSQQQFIHQQSSCDHQQNLIFAAAAACVGNTSVSYGCQNDLKNNSHQNASSNAAPTLHTFLNLQQEFPSFTNLSPCLSKDNFATTGWRPETNGYWPSNKNAYWSNSADSYQQATFPANAGVYPNVITALADDGRFSAKNEYSVPFPQTCSSLTTQPDLPPFVTQPSLGILKYSFAEDTPVQNNVTETYGSDTTYKNDAASTFQTTDCLQLTIPDAQHLAEFNFISEATNTLLN